MGDVIKGVVQAIETRSVAGGKTAYNVVVAGQSYGAGLYAPKAREGDYVQFEVDDSRGYKNVARGTLKVSTGKPPAEAVAEAAATAPQRTASGGVVDNRQDTISKQAALNSAIAFLSVAQSAEALGLPKTDTKGQRIAALDAMLVKYTQDFYQQSTGNEWKGKTILSEDDAPASDEVPEAPEDQPWE